MKARCYSIPESCPDTSRRSQTVQVEVSLTHPLLLLKRVLPWEAITEVIATAQIRDHSHIARAYAALGKTGLDEVNHLIIQEAHG